MQPAIRSNARQTRQTEQLGSSAERSRWRWLTRSGADEGAQYRQARGRRSRAGRCFNCRIEGEPGRYFEYNNYKLLPVGKILERATGMPVSCYLREELWKPMGMEMNGS
jgi:CubicO group peptidase (beta-lactamase class C family)